MLTFSIPYIFLFVSFFFNVFHTCAIQYPDLPFYQQNEIHIKKLSQQFPGLVRPWKWLDKTISIDVYSASQASIKDANPKTIFVDYLIYKPLQSKKKLFSNAFALSKDFILYRYSSVLLRGGSMVSRWVDQTPHLLDSIQHPHNPHTAQLRSLQVSFGSPIVHKIIPFDRKNSFYFVNENGNYWSTSNSGQTYLFNVQTQGKDFDVVFTSTRSSRSIIAARPNPQHFCPQVASQHTQTFSNHLSPVFNDCPAELYASRMNGKRWMGPIADNAIKFEFSPFMGHAPTMNAFKSDSFSKYNIHPNIITNQLTQTDPQTDYISGPNVFLNHAFTDAQTWISKNTGSQLLIDIDKKFNFTKETTLSRYLVLDTLYRYHPFSFEKGTISPTKRSSSPTLEELFRHVHKVVQYRYGIPLSLKYNFPNYVSNETEKISSSFYQVVHICTSDQMVDTSQLDLLEYFFVTFRSLYPSIFHLPWKQVSRESKPIRPFLPTFYGTPDDTSNIVTDIGGNSLSDTPGTPATQKSQAKISKKFQKYLKHERAFGTQESRSFAPHLFSINKMGFEKANHFTGLLSNYDSIWAAENLPFVSDQDEIIHTIPYSFDTLDHPYHLNLAKESYLFIYYHVAPTPFGSILRFFISLFPAISPDPLRIAALNQDISVGLTMGLNINPNPSENTPQMYVSDPKVSGFFKDLFKLFTFQYLRSNNNNNNNKENKFSTISFSQTNTSPSNQACGPLLCEHHIFPIHYMDDAPPIFYGTIKEPASVFFSVIGCVIFAYFLFLHCYDWFIDKTTFLGTELKTCKTRAIPCFEPSSKQEIFFGQQPQDNDLKKFKSDIYFKFFFHAPQQYPFWFSTFCVRFTWWLVMFSSVVHHAWHYPLFEYFDCLCVILCFASTLFSAIVRGFFITKPSFKIIAAFASYGPFFWYLFKVMIPDPATVGFLFFKWDSGYHHRFGQFYLILYILSIITHTIWVRKQFSWIKLNFDIFGDVFFVNSKNRNLIPVEQVYNNPLVQLWIGLLVLMATSSLELFDFDPIWGIFDPHSLWHATILYLAFQWDSFVQSDIRLVKSVLAFEKSHDVFVSQKDHPPPLNVFQSFNQYLARPIGLFTERHIIYRFSGISFLLCTACLLWDTFQL